MKGSSLRFYVHENRKHRGRPLYEWLLDEARRRGIHGGCAFRSIAGFGRHGVLQEDHFFELAGELSVLVEFVVSEREADELLGIVHAEGTPIFYARTSTEFGVLGDGERSD
ncbi:MAG TPA: DUF190 domain-containing protein [Dokdonella sp.]